MASNIFMLITPHFLCGLYSHSEFQTCISNYLLDIFPWISPNISQLTNLRKISCFFTPKLFHIQSSLMWENATNIPEVTHVSNLGVILKCPLPPYTPHYLIHQHILNPTTSISLYCYSYPTLAANPLLNFRNHHFRCCVGERHPLELYNDQSAGL